MDEIKDLNYKGNSKESSRNSKAFRYCISVLFEEIELAILWDRPSILLAIHPSNAGKEKAQGYLQGALNRLSATVIYVNLNSERPDLFQTIDQAHGSGKVVFFVDGIGRDKNTYRALNLRREDLVEKRIAIVFWLSENEAKELPRYAPDFWAFRHRVVEFAPSRGSKNKALPSGILLWQAEPPYQIHESIDEKISHQEVFLQELSPNDNALMLYSEAIHHLAYLYWWNGKTEEAKSLLEKELDRTVSFHVQQVTATLLNGLAIISYDKQEYGQAEAYFHRAISMDPSNALLLTNLGVTCHAQGKSGLGVRHIRKGLTLAPKQPWLLYILGYVYFSLGNMDAAQSYFEESLTMSGDNTYAAYAITICHGRTKNLDGYKKSLEYLTERVALNLYDEICKDALKDTTSALQKLHQATQNGIFPPALIQRDPVLNLFLKI